MPNGHPLQNGHGQGERIRGRCGFLAFQGRAVDQGGAKWGRRYFSNHETLLILYHSIFLGISMDFFHLPTGAGFNYVAYEKLDLTMKHLGFHGILVETHIGESSTTMHLVCQ